MGKASVQWWGVRGVCTGGARRSLKSGGSDLAEPVWAAEGTVDLDPEGL